MVGNRKGKSIDQFNSPMQSFCYTNCHVEEFVVGNTRQLEETCTLLYCHVCLPQIQPKCFFYCTSPTPTVRCSGAEERASAINTSAVVVQWSN